MKIIGHQKNINFLERSLEKEIFGGAYIFTGPEHVGKFSTAFWLAQKATGSEAKINPDIIIVEPEVEEKKGILKKKDIKIEDIRELEKGLMLSPYFGKFKVAIVDDADKLTRAAQNALLKTLEEPQEKVAIILIVHNQDKILPTLKSRSIIRKFSLVNKRDIAKLLTKKETDEDIFWSLGRPGLANSLSQDKQKLKEAINLAQKSFKEIKGMNLGEKFSLAEKLSKDVTNLLQVLDLWSVILRENILTGKANQEVLSDLEEIEKTKRFINETNANVRYLLEKLFLNIN